MFSGSFDDPGPAITGMWDLSWPDDGVDDDDDSFTSFLSFPSWFVFWDWDRDNLFTAALVFFPEDDNLDILFLFQSGVVTTLGGLFPAVLCIIGVDEDDVLLLPPLVDGDEGRGGRVTGGLQAPLSSSCSSSPCPCWWATP